MHVASAMQFDATFYFGEFVQKRFHRTSLKLRKNCTVANCPEFISNTSLNCLPFRPTAGDLTCLKIVIVPVKGATKK